MRPFRFGLQAQSGGSPEKLRSEAEAAEAAGFDVICTWDHLGDSFSALLPLAAVAQWTETIRLCPLVLNNDFHHPALLAQELASLDRLSNGRLEVGIGAGHSFTEYAAAGIPFDGPALRKERLGEAVGLLRRLLDGEEVTAEGEHYRLEGVRVLTPVQSHVPILVGVNGKPALARAARQADTIGLTMVGRTLDDGQRHAVRWQPERLDETVAFIEREAGDRDVELNALVQVVEITDDREEAAARLAAEVEGLSGTDALSTPFLALGTHEEIASHLSRCRERWGISYFVVRVVEEMAPVIELLRAADSASS